MNTLGAPCWAPALVAGLFNSFTEKIARGFSTLVQPDSPWPKGGWRAYRRRAGAPPWGRRPRRTGP